METLFSPFEPAVPELFELTYEPIATELSLVAQELLPTTVVPFPSAWVSPPIAVAN